ncbi:hypothetical protein IAU60_000628 [Kwoniella sp. DSM 27419]
MAQSQTSPTILLFARGTLALLDMWPALTVAVAEQWGGPESAAKKTWLASTLIDEFEARATYLPVTGADANAPQVVDPASANDPPLDHDELGDLLHQIMSDEFDANIEDGSIDSVAADLVRLWRDVLGPEGSLLVQNLESKADEVRGKALNGSTVPEEEVSGDEDDDEDEDMEVDGGAPQLVESRAPKERQEPVVDDDGFELVQKKGRR